MFFQVVIPDLAQADIENLAQYIFIKYLDRETAKRVYNEIYSAIATLDFMPHRYESFQLDYKRMIVG